MRVADDNISCLILAAGASARFGSSKMLHRLADGTEILAKTIAIYQQVFERVNVVVGQADDALIHLVEKQGAVSILNPSFDQGLSQSIVAGIKASQPSSAWMIALGDMPYVSVETVASLVLNVDPQEIVVPKTAIGTGNPVVLGTRFKADLLALHGDIGAKPLLTRHPDAVRFYHCDDLGIHQDIDRLSDVLPDENLS